MSLRFVKGAMTDPSLPCITERCKKPRRRGVLCDKCSRRLAIRRSQLVGKQLVPHPTVRLDGTVRYTSAEATLAWPVYNFDPTAYLLALGEALDRG